MVLNSNCIFFFQNYSWMPVTHFLNSKQERIGLRAQRTQFIRMQMVDDCSVAVLPGKHGLESITGTQWGSPALLCLGLEDIEYKIDNCYICPTYCGRQRPASQIQQHIRSGLLWQEVLGKSTSPVCGWGWRLMRAVWMPGSSSSFQLCWLYS